MSGIKEHYHDQIEAGQRGGQHKIGWLNMPGYKPETWNPIVGCTKVSAGCENCYAEVMATRLAGIAIARMVPMSIGKYVKVIMGRKWNGSTFLNVDELAKPMKWKTPRMIFVSSMGDLFHESVPFEWIDRVFETIENAFPEFDARKLSNHLFIILTKRPARMLEYINDRKTRGLAYGHSNVWMGVTIENQEQANIRIPILLGIAAAKRFVSVEPMLGPVDLTQIQVKNEKRNSIFGGYRHIDKLYWPKLDWVICGGESGPKARPMHPDWVRSLRRQCQGERVPFFFKGWGTYRAITTTNFIENLPIGDYDVNTKFGFVKANRTMIGNTIDNREWMEWPEE